MNRRVLSNSMAILTSMVALLFIFHFILPGRAFALTCGVSDWSTCIVTEQGCEGDQWLTVECEQQQPQCAPGETGTPACYHQGISWIGLDYCGVENCITSPRSLPAGDYCNGCIPPAEPPPNCGNGVIDPGEQCDAPAMGSCTNGCSSSCTCNGAPPPPPCSCNPTCTPPSGLNITAPAAGSAVFTGSTITWQLGSWGLDSNSSACSNNQCSYQGYSGAGTFRLFIDDTTNISSRCQGHQGSGNNAYLTSSQCTLTSVDPSWPDTSHIFTVRAYSLCSETGASRAYGFPPNLPPFCSQFTVNAGAGRIAGGKYANYPDNQFSITVNAGETDPYGNPNHIRFCYKIASQPDPGAQWVCPTIVVNGTSGVFTSTFNLMKAHFVGNLYYDQIDDVGFWTTANIYDNVTPVNFCNGWDMYQPIGGSCDGGSCLLRFNNQPPSITATTPDHDDNTVIGTATDSDNGPMCSDNNPMTFSMTASDPDGAADIDRMEFALARPDGLNPSGGERYLPLRVMFAKKLTMPGYQQFANNTFMIRDTTVDQNTSSDQWCIRSNGSTQLFTTANSGWSPNFIDPTNVNNTLQARSNTNLNVFCYGLDSHTWSDGAYTTTTIGGVQFYVWYLTSDLTTIGDGYSATLKGTPNFDSVNGTYVLYQQNGNGAQAHFKVQFNGEGANKWNGEYSNLWMVVDEYGEFDETASLPGESIIQYTGGNYQHRRGTTTIDLQRPILTYTSNPPVVVSAELLRLDWTATDAHTGVQNIYAEATKTGGAILPNIDAFPIFETGGAQYNPWPSSLEASGDYSEPAAADFLYTRTLTPTASTSDSAVINIGDNEQGGFRFEGYAVDVACNMNNNPTNESEIDLFEPWFLSRAGLVYTDSIQSDAGVIDFDDPPRNLCPAGDQSCAEFNAYPYHFLNNQIDITSEWIGANSAISNNIFVNSASNRLFRTANYNDENNRSWYDELSKKAEKTLLTTPNGVSQATVSGTLPAAVSAIPNCSDSNKPCLIKSDSAITIASNFSCDRKAVFLVSSLTIDGDITASSPTNGCIFVTSGGVTIADGTYKSGSSTYPRYDLIQAFIIADGIVDIPEVDIGTNIRDGLKIHGGLLGFGNNASGSSLNMQRSLQLKNNAQFPTYVFHHDTRYFEIAASIFSNDREAIKQEVGFKP